MCDCQYVLPWPNQFLNANFYYSPYLTLYALNGLHNWTQNAQFLKL